MEHASTNVDHLLEELYAFGQSEGGMWNVGREGGELLAWLVGLLDAKRVLEIGTSNGVSTIWLARALNETGGHLVTLEVEPRKVEMATVNLQKVDLFDTVTIIEGPAIRSLETLGGEFDLVFIDADKPQYPDYLRGVRNLVHTGSVIVADNVSESNEVSLPYREAAAADDGLESIGMSIAGGFWVSRVK